MNKDNKNYWQISAGDFGRNYREYFLKFGLAFVGKGTKRFDEIKEADILVLKSGRKELISAGEVVKSNNGEIVNSATENNKSWLLDFDGWELPEYCHVNWRYIPDSDLNSINKNLNKTKNFQRTAFCALNNTHKGIADYIVQNYKRRKCNSEPDQTRTITNQEIKDHLVALGKGVNRIKEIIFIIDNIRSLVKFYFAYDKEFKKFNWQNIREHEIRTFLVIPLLLALGWSEQCMKIELPVTKKTNNKRGKKAKGKIDIVCYNKPYNSKDADPILIVETKSFSYGLDYAAKQAQKYAESLKSDSGNYANIVLVTNGHCYRVFKKENNKSWKFCAHLNIRKPKDKYALDSNIKGALGALDSMLFIP